MRRLLLAIVLLLLSSAYLRAGVMVDRIAATVKGHIIFASDVQREVAYQCLLNPPDCKRDSVGVTAALNRLIDRQLIAQQIGASSFPPTDEAEVRIKIANLKSQLLHGGNGNKNGNSKDESAAWEALLTQYGLSAEDVEMRIRTELEEMRFIEARFRPAVRVPTAAIQRYYQQKLLPKLPADAKPPELQQVSPEIREILTQQAINQQLDAWLTSLRQHSEVEVR